MKTIITFLLIFISINLYSQDMEHTYEIRMLMLQNNVLETRVNALVKDSILYHEVLDYMGDSIETPIIDIQQLRLKQEELHFVSYSNLYSYKSSNKWITIGAYIISISLNAIGDGMNMKGRKELGHALNAASIGTLVALPLFVNFDKKKWYMYAISYTFIRAGLFDPLINRVINKPFNYTGNESLTDKAWGKIQSDVFTRCFLVSVGVLIPLNVL
jgi:hypothetical protein